MKKYLLFLFALIFSLTFFNFKTYAQDAPNSLYKIDYTTYEFIQENTLTYEYLVYYFTPLGIYDNIDENDYFLVNTIDVDNVNLVKGLNRNLNSYEFEDKHVYITDGTSIILRVTISKSFVDGGYLGGDVESLFKLYLYLYVYFYEGGNPDYTRGYLDGYDEGFENGKDEGYDLGYENGHEEGQEVGYTLGYYDGYNLGYDVGYDEGASASQSEAYQAGYNKGAEEAFIANLHVWLVPAMIIVVIVGIFVGYRRKDE